MVYLPPIGDTGLVDGVGVGDVDFVAVVPVDGAVAAVGVGDGHDGDDDVVADLLDERGVFGGEAVGELHEHLGGTEFGGVEASGEGVDGLGGGDESFGLRVGEGAGIGELGEILSESVEVGDGVFGADEDDDGGAAFFGGADGDDLHARGFAARAL